VFLSFSGPVSHEVAQLFYGWLPRVIQSLRPYMSSVDIDKGARWSSDIAGQLQDTHHGILFVTKGNVTSPWLNFEAGALSKSLSESRVSPFLFNVNPTDLIGGPLAQLQGTKNTREDIKKLVFSLNRAGAELLVDGEMLNTTFDKWWDELGIPLGDLARRIEQEPEEQETRPEVDANQILVQIYEMQLAMQGRLADLEESSRAAFQGLPRRSTATSTVTISRVVDRLSKTFPQLSSGDTFDAVVEASQRTSGLDDMFRLARDILVDRHAPPGMSPFAAGKEESRTETSG
jgi:hypothetical protein